MNEPLLFVFGLIVTLVAVGAVGTIWWAAIQDGRMDREMRELREREEAAAAAERRRVELVAVDAGRAA
jgi:hypothetical protein